MARIQFTLRQLFAVVTATAVWGSGVATGRHLAGDGGAIAIGFVGAVPIYLLFYLPVAWPQLSTRKRVALLIAFCTSACGLLLLIVSLFFVGLRMQERMALRAAPLQGVLNRDPRFRSVQLSPDHPWAPERLRVHGTVTSEESLQELYRATEVMDVEIRWDVTVKPP